MKVVIPRRSRVMIIRGGGIYENARPEFTEMSGQVSLNIFP